MKHDREPVKHTCPDIDKVLTVFENVLKRCRLKGGEEESELKEIIEDIQYELWDVDTIMERIRSANDSLRTWGIEEAEKVDKLEEIIYELNEELSQQ